MKIERQYKLYKLGVVVPENYREVFVFIDNTFYNLLELKDDANVYYLERKSGKKQRVFQYSLRSDVYIDYFPFLDDLKVTDEDFYCQIITLLRTLLDELYGLTTRFIYTTDKTR